MRKLLAAAFASLLLLSGMSVTAKVYAATEEEKNFGEFVNQYVKKAAPLEKEVNSSEWNAYVSGKKEDYDKKAKASLQLDMLHSDKEAYGKLIAWKESGNIKDAAKKRELEILINAYGPRQISHELMTEIGKKESELQHKFNNYRGEINGKKVTERDIYDILRDSTDRNHRRAAWEAQKAVGPEVAKDLVELVKLRNKAAKELGFKNYYEMQIVFGDQSVKELTEIFDKLVKSTEEPFRHYKAELDKITAKKLAVKVEELRPWDYQNPFFQAADGTFTSDTEKLYQDRNLPLVNYNFYDGIGLNLGDVLKRSDLYEKEGKSQHAFCFDIDRNNDIRIMMNLRNDEDSFSTLLHESGHAVYDLNINKSMPWLFRTQAHIFTTEASAMFFERMTKNSQWLVKNLGANPQEAEKLGQNLRKDQALQDVVFCRWTVVMFNFEKALYENPDQDLNKLWWELVEKYQHIAKPEGRNLPDWSSKIHLVSSPVYYHNYMMGNLMVSQILHTIGTKVVKTPDWTSIDVTGQKEVGRWLKENIYRPGAKYRWDELLKRATGESLNPDYFAEQVKKAEK